MVQDCHPWSRECEERRPGRELTNVQWVRISNLIPGKRGRAGEDNRLFVDAVFFRAPAGDRSQSG